MCVMTGWLPYVTMSLLMFCGMLLIFIILLQRGRGGGLAGALGGAGGQSAFGTKAGDVFTKITVGLAMVWVLFAVINVYAMRQGSTKFKGGTDAVPTAPSLTADPLKDPAATGLTAPADTEIKDPAATDAAAPQAPESGTPEAAAPASPEKTDAEKPATEEAAKSPTEAEAKTPEPAAEKSADPAAPAEAKAPQ